MATQVYNEYKRALLAGEVDMDTADVRVALLMTNTTADTENDGVTRVNGFTTLDEFDGANYSRKALANELVRKDDANDRAEFDADDVIWTSLGVGTRDVEGVLVFLHNFDGVATPTDANHLPVAFLDFAANKTPDGSDFTLQWDTEGILQAT